MRILLIWDDNPERTRIYEELVTPEEFKTLSRTHGKLMNSANNTPEDEDALMFVSEWLVGRTPIFDTEKSDNPIKEVLTCSIIHTGFIM